MHDFKWSSREKTIARSAFDHALDVWLTRLMTEFKAKADSVATPSEMFEMEDYLKNARREIEVTFDYRYSQLIWVFAQLIFQGRLDEERLAGLSDEKLAAIRSNLSFMNK